MMNLEKLKDNQEIIDSIDWDMTPEEAVRLYLEWGNNWSRGNYVIRSKDDVAYYFVVNSWDEAPVIYLVKRSSENAEELAKIEPPDEFVDDFIRNKMGIYALDGELKSWLMGQLDAD